jgi:hypothetical protein
VISPAGGDHPIEIAIAFFVSSDNSLMELLTSSDWATIVGFEISRCRIELAAVKGFNPIVLAGFLELYVGARIPMFCQGDSLHAQFRHAGHMGFYGAESIPVRERTVGMKADVSHYAPHLAFHGA